MYDRWQDQEHLDAKCDGDSVKEPATVEWPHVLLLTELALLDTECYHPDAEDIGNEQDQRHEDGRQESTNILLLGDRFKVFNSISVYVFRAD